MKSNAVSLLRFATCMLFITTVTIGYGQHGRGQAGKGKVKHDYTDTPLPNYPPEPDYAQRLEKQTAYDKKYLYPEFVTGKVFIKAKIAGGLKVNYHKLFAALVFINAKGDTTALNDNPAIEFVQTPQNLFYNHQKEGFLELLSPQDAEVWLLKRMQLKAVKTVYISNNPNIKVRSLAPDTVNFYHVIYKPRDPSRMLMDVTFDDVNEYFIADKNKDLSRVTRNNFFKAFPKYREQMKSWMDENKIDLDYEEDIIKLYEYCVSLK